MNDVFTTPEARPALFGSTSFERIPPNPMVTLNHAVAVTMVPGPQAGLDLLTRLDDDHRIASHHRLEAVRAHLLEMAGDLAAARSSYRIAARRTTSLPESVTSRPGRPSSAATADRTARSSTLPIEAAVTLLER
jgi:hypothetical protein